MTSQAERSKRWYAKNKDHANQLSAEWYKQHHEEQNAKRRAKYQAIKSDPIQWAEYQKKERERQKRKAANRTDKQRQRSREVAVEYRKRRPEANRRAALKSHYKVRAECLAHYGGKCACCGETTQEFLAIDHINGGGNEHRRSIGKTGGMYFWLRLNGFPEGFQVLCWNCNHAKGAHGVCPHQLMR